MEWQQQLAALVKDKTYAECCYVLSKCTLNAPTLNETAVELVNSGNLRHESPAKSNNANSIAAVNPLKESVDYVKVWNSYGMSEKIPVRNSKQSAAVNKFSVDKYGIVIRLLEYNKTDDIYGWTLVDGEPISIHATQREGTMAEIKLASENKQRQIRSTAFNDRGVIASIAKELESAIKAESAFD